MNPKHQPIGNDPTILGNDKPRRDSDTADRRPDDVERKPVRRESQDQATHRPEDRRGEERDTM